MMEAMMEVVLRVHGQRGQQKGLVHIQLENVMQMLLIALAPNIHAKPETASNSRMHVTEVVESPEEGGQYENTSPQKEQDVDISSDLIDSDQQLERFEEQRSGTEHSKSSLHLDFKLPDTENVTNIFGNANKACANLSSINSQTESRSSNGYSKLSFKDKIKFDLKEGPSLELKLEAGARDIRSTLHVDSNILGHSDISAFSKYVSGPSANQKDSSGRPVRPGTTEDAAINSSQMEPRDLNQVYVEHHHHYYHHYHHHVDDTQKHKASKDLAKCVPKVAPLAAPQCGSSNAISGPVELNLGNYSMNGSGSGSNYGSNGQNGSSILTPNTGTTNITCDAAMPVNSASGD